jgi:hypothetical protein
MSIERPRTTRQRIYLVYAWVGALTGLALTLGLPLPLQNTFIFMSRHLASASVVIALCIFAVLAKRSCPERVRQGLCVLLGFLSASLTVSLVS